MEQKTIRVTDSTGRVIATYPIALGALNYEVSEQEYFDQAKKMLIEDGLATKAQLPDLTFTVTD